MLKKTSNLHKKLKHQSLKGQRGGFRSHRDLCDTLVAGSFHRCVVVPEPGPHLGNGSRGPWAPSRDLIVQGSWVLFWGVEVQEARHCPRRGSPGPWALSWGVVVQEPRHYPGVVIQDSRHYPEVW